jgi:hypothetical protein
MSALYFDPEQHVYTIDGQRVVSVTQAIQSLVDFSRVPAWQLEWKAALGTAVHKACELYDMDDLEPLDDDDPALGYVVAWMKFRIETGFQPVELEQRIYHSLYEYAGTLDRVGYMRKGAHPDRLGVYEIKTTATLPELYARAQTAAYFAAYNRTRPREERARERYAVHLQKDGRYTLHAFEDHAGDLALFLDHLRAYQERNAA